MVKRILITRLIRYIVGILNFQVAIRAGACNEGKCGMKENADYNAAKNIANGGLNCTPKSNEAVLTA